MQFVHVSFLFSRLCPMGPAIFGVQARLDSTLLKTDAKCAELFLACCGGDSENKPIADIFTASILWPSHYTGCPFCCWPSSNPDEWLMQTAFCLWPNATYDRRAAKFRGMERTLAWYSASLEWKGSGTRTATWIEHLVGTMPQTSLEICDACCEFALEPVGQASVALESGWCITRGYPHHDWTSKLVVYMRFQQWGQWYNPAHDPALWMRLSDDFVRFCSTRWRFGLTLPAPQGGLPSDMQAQT